MSDGTDLQGFSGPSPAPGGTPAPPPPELNRPAGSPPVDNPRARGHSPAADARAAQQELTAANRISIDGVDYNTDDVRAALSHKAESDVRSRSLPESPDRYEIKLPANFQAPAGVKFEFDQNDPALAEFRKVAHARGVSQDEFSDYLGVFAATKISEQTRVAAARDAELAKLGSAAPNRVAAVQTWLKARAGADAEVLVNQLAKFPHAGMVGAFEKIMRAFTNQGGAEYSQGGRHHEENNSGRIPGYENMSFTERRVSQMQMAARGQGGRGRE